MENSRLCQCFLLCYLLFLLCKSFPWTSTEIQEHGRNLRGSRGGFCLREPKEGDCRRKVDGLWKRERSISARKKKKSQWNFRWAFYMWLWLFYILYSYCPFCKEGAEDEQSVWVTPWQRHFLYQELHRIMNHAFTVLLHRSFLYEKVKLQSAVFILLAYWTLFWGISERLWVLSTVCDIQKLVKQRTPLPHP